MTWGIAMPAEEEFVIDFVARGEVPGEWRLVLIEKGPWPDTNQGLLRLQDRLYNCVDAILDGQVTEQFPDAKKARLVIQVDCYEVPQEAVANFFAMFSEGIFQIPDYKKALEASEHTSGIGFTINYNKL